MGKCWPNQFGLFGVTWKLITVYTWNFLKLFILSFYIYDKTFKIFQLFLILKFMFDRSVKTIMCD